MLCIRHVHVLYSKIFAMLLALCSYETSTRVHHLSAKLLIYFSSLTYSKTRRGNAESSFVYLFNFLNVLRTRFLFVNNFTLFLQFIFRDNLWFFSLRRHRVRIVNDYFSTCPHSQRLGRHSVSVVNGYVDTQFSKMSNYIFCNFFVIFFTFSKVK